MAEEKKPRAVKPKDDGKVQELENKLATVENELAFYTDKSKLTLVPAAPITKEQILTIFQKTPAKHVYTRPAKGGGTWDYVTATYVKKVLNYVFGFMWDFEIVEHGREGNQVWVKGRLTVKDAKHGTSITKMQFGRAEIKIKKDTKEALDFGNDLKAAASDALKKCAAEFGIASDIYGKNEFQEVRAEKPRTVKADIVQEATPQPKAQPQGENCEDCVIAEADNPGISITDANYSRAIYGRPLCRGHQATATRIQKHG